MIKANEVVKAIISSINSAMYQADHNGEHEEYRTLDSIFNTVCTVWLNFLTQYFTKSLVPVCSDCHCIRLTYPDTTVVYIDTHKSFYSWLECNRCVCISHTICPTCLELHYPEIAAQKKQKQKT